MTRTESVAKRTVFVLFTLPQTPLMPTAPACQFFQRRTQCRTISGQGVHRAQHILAMHLPLHDAGALKFPQLRREHFLRDLRDATLQIAVAFMARFELTQDQRLPLASDHVDRHRDGTLSSQHEYNIQAVPAVDMSGTKKCVIDTGCRPKERCEQDNRRARMWNFQKSDDAPGAGRGGHS